MASATNGQPNGNGHAHATGNGSLIHVPQSVEDMLPPKPASALSEMISFERKHWQEIKHYVLGLSGEAPSINGSPDLDEAGCIFKIQEIAKKNGFAILATLNAAQLRRLHRRAIKANTGVRHADLLAQNRRLRIEHQKSNTTQA